jgi:DNA-binding LacI/PurR family transcriptional regulator
MFGLQGRRRIALVMPGRPWIPEKAYFESTFREAVERFPQSVGMEFTIGAHVHSGMAMGEKLLAMRPEDRPDALICTLDDYVALGIAHAIQPEQAYRPGIATLTNRQSPLPFPLPVYRFELDLMEMAKQSVAFLLEGLHEPNRTKSSRRLIPRLNEEEASELPRAMMNWGRNLMRHSTISDDGNNSEKTAKGAYHDMADQNTA